MASYIKDSSNYGLYIMESDSSNNDDWVSDHDAMKEADLDQFTEGNDYIYLPYAGNLRKISEYKVKVADFFGGQGAKIGIGEGHFIYKVNGRYQGTGESDRDNQEAYIDEFFKRHMDVTGNDIYIGYRKIGENWKQFVDNNYNHKGYCKGVFAKPITERKPFDNYFEWEIIFREAW